VPNTQLGILRSTQTVPTATRIELPRPAIIAALGVAILAIAFLVTKAGDQNASVSAPIPAVTGTHTTSAASTTTTPSSTSTTTTTAQPAKPKQPTLVPGPGLPRDVAHALNADKVVVLFFYDPAGSDDQATRSAIHAVRTVGGPVSLFEDTVVHVARYRRVIGSLGVSQTPAMVVIDRNRQAKLLQGYLDAGTIRQTVRDAF
jgi:hypothetical protein